MVLGDLTDYWERVCSTCSSERTTVLRLPRGPLIAIAAALAVVAASFAPHSQSSADAANVDTGVWGAPFTPPNAVTAVHIALLHNGKLLMFGEEGVTAIW